MGQKLGIVEVISIASRAGYQGIEPGFANSTNM